MSLKKGNFFAYARKRGRKQVFQKRSALTLMAFIMLHYRISKRYHS